MNRILLLISFWLLFVPALACSQTTPDLEQGLKPFGSYEGGNLDSVSLLNGNLTVQIPLLSYPQRGNQHFSFSLVYNNKSFVYQLSQLSGYETFWYYWIGGGIQLVRDQSLKNAAIQTKITYIDPNDPCDPKCNQKTRYAVLSGIQTADGNTHTEAAGVAGAAGRAMDLSGWTGTTDSFGTRHAVSGIDEDSNGNQITATASGWTDTVGRFVPGSATQTDTPADSTMAQKPGAVPTPFDPAFPGVPTTNLSPCPSGTTAARDLTVPVPNSGTANYKLCFSDYAVQTAFPVPPPDGSLGISVHQFTGTLRLLSAVVLPDATSWQFGYTQQGDLWFVRLPTGGTIEYTWTNFMPYGAKAYSRAVLTRTLNLQDGSTPRTWTYSYRLEKSVYPNMTTTTVTTPDGNDTVHVFPGQYETQTTYYQGPAANNNWLKNVATTYHSDPNPYAQDFLGIGGMNVYPTKKVTTWANGQTTESDFVYDSSETFIYTDPHTLNKTTYPITIGSLLRQTDYDYGTNSPGPLLRTIDKTFLWQSNATYKNLNLINLVSTEYLCSPAQSYDNAQATACPNLVAGLKQRSRTDHEYDSGSLQSSGITTARNTAPTNGANRGNRTATVNWLNVGGNSPRTTYAFFDTGELYQKVDPKGNDLGTPALYTTTYSYSSAYAGAYVTGTTDQLGHTVSATYDINSGLMASFTDQNSRTTTYRYDVMGRPTAIVHPPESTGTGETDISYRMVLPATMTVSRNIDGTRWKTDTTTFDGFGRPVQTQHTSDGQGTVFVDTSYDASGRVFCVSNPYRSTSEPTYGSTCSYYDALGRKTLEVPPDGTTNSNNVQTAYVGSTTTVIDQAGRSKSMTSDSLGRLKQVIENPTTLNGAASYETDYTYDGLGDILCVEQHGDASSGTGCSMYPNAFNSSSNPWRVRQFFYDSLSRLTRSDNPESGTINFNSYDANGNLISKTDARNITVTYNYDRENRLLGKTYSNNDPAVGYVYDQSTDGVHHRRAMTDASGSTTWTYDERGRVKNEHRQIGTVTKDIQYQYNLLGLPTSITYPNGTIISYQYDSDARVATVRDTAHGINYVTGVTSGQTCPSPDGPSACYTPWGDLASYVSGYNSGFAGITLTNQFNNRLQPAAITASSPSQTLLSYSYSFNQGSPNAPINNGNLASLANNLDPTRSKTFVYDALNRISEYKTPYSSLWDVKYSIDPWGNLYAKTRQPNYGGESLETQPTMANRLIGYGYDFGGNLTSDGQYTYWYDAENRIKTAAGEQYAYDGDGERVQKASGTSYWGSSSDGALLETDNSGSPKAEYIFFNGKRIARRDLPSGAVIYYFADHLGSATVVADAQGDSVVTSDYAPYGELHWQTGSDTNHYLFTGKERDFETGLDYFGARYYGSNTGRWMNPDWASVPTPVPYGSFGEPQSLNLYSYVRNNPMSRGDVDGHCDTLQACIAAIRSFVSTPVNYHKEAAVVNERSADPSTNLSNSNVRAVGVYADAQAHGLNSSVGAGAYFARTELSFGDSADKVSGTVTNNFGTADVNASAGEHGTYKVEADAKLGEWGGSLNIGGLKIEGSVCLVCVGAEASATWNSGTKGAKGGLDIGVAGATLGLSYQNQKKTVKTTIPRPACSTGPCPPAPPNAK